MGELSRPRHLHPVGPLTFPGTFDGDLEAFAQAFEEGTPFALSRFGDGEWGIAAGQLVYQNTPTEKWVSHRGMTPTRKRMLRALQYRATGYCIGICAPCCMRSASEFLARTARVHPAQRTFATLFCHANYARFLELPLMDKAVLVSSSQGDFDIPTNALSEDWDLAGLVQELRNVDRPILVAAGPASCFLIHEYWRQQPPQKRQTIVDIGAAYDPWLHSQTTRPYQDPGSPWREHVCVW